MSLNLRIFLSSSKKTFDINYLNLSSLVDPKYILIVKILISWLYIRDYDKMNPHQVPDWYGFVPSKTC